MIEFESVSKTFAGGTRAVQDLSLTIPSDKITVIVGPSGCGKTTTLRMINRMLEPSSGRITWDNTPLKSRRKTTLRRQMGYVIQSGGLFPHRTVLDNIGTVPGLLGWSKDKIRKRSLELLGNVGLDRVMADRYPAQLSGGQQQRVGVARALAADPLVMLMDEPFSAVDPVVRSELHEFFLGLQREISKTIVLITHDIEEAIKLGDQVAILRVGGRLAQAGPPQELLDQPADAFVEGFVGRDRGYRSLSFLPAAGLSLDEVAVVRDASSGGGSGPTLVLDGDARPVGWVDQDRAGLVYPVGATFVRETDTLRAALDSALTSPFGLAVSIDGETGRYTGVVGADAILAQVATQRTEPSDAVSISDAEAKSEQTREAQAAVTSAYVQLEGGGADEETGAAADPTPAAEARAEEPEAEAEADADPATAATPTSDEAAADAAAEPELEPGAEPEATAEPEPGPGPGPESAEPDPPRTVVAVPEDEQPTMIRREPASEPEGESAPSTAPPETASPADDEARDPVIYTQPRMLPDRPGEHG